MFTVFLWMLLAATPEPPPPRPDDEAAKKRFEQLVERFRRSEGLDVIGKVAQKMSMDGQDFELGQKGITHLARPLHGRVTIGQVNEQFELPPQVIIADGESVYMLDTESKQAQVLGSNLWVPFPSLELCQAWIDPKADLHAEKTELASEGELEKLTVTFGSGAVETYWLKGETLERAQSVQTHGDQKMEATFTFEKFVLTEKVDLKRYAESLPEGYEISDPMAELEADLLAVGSEVPDISVTTMQDESLSLRSLSGKTVLLNFWFYH
ncbi:MAG: hypothetical protein RL885_18615 [Planctomycetota bacterium]